MSNDRVVLVRHKISGVTVELPERHLAHPILGEQYELVKIKDGKPVTDLAGNSKVVDAEKEIDTDNGDEKVGVKK